jgi:hypothetical protein
MVRRLFRIALLALNISSRRARWAVGRQPSIFRRNSSSSRAFKESGPKISSGVEKLVRR